MATKRYYWLKLSDSFFDSIEIKYMMRQPDGSRMALAYLRLASMSITNNGELCYRGLGASLAEELAVVLDTETEVMQAVLDYIVRCGMAEYTDENTLYMAAAMEMVGTESESTQRVRRMRSRSGSAEADTKLSGTDVVPVGYDVPSPEPEVSPIGYDVPPCEPELPPVGYDVPPCEPELPPVGYDVSSSYPELSPPADPLPVVHKLPAAPMKKNKAAAKSAETAAACADTYPPFLKGDSFEDMYARVYNDPFLSDEEKLKKRKAITQLYLDSIDSYRRAGQ